MLEIYDSLRRAKREFAPRVPGRVGMYVCGMTVYDDCHLGHARMLVVFDMVVRYLRARGLEVKHVCNITDIDDKIISRAQELEIDWRALTERTIASMYEDMAALNVARADLEPRASEHIPAMLKLIERLLANDSAYVSDGDVLFRVRRFPRYGALSGRSLEELRAGARVAVGEHKDDPLDFALWKAAKPGEPSWDSPWGAGRPGWHIECSAMSMQHLGESFDIHGGGLDLKFPHHENEIAQSESATHCEFAGLWMHNGHVRVADQKMAKSLGNFITLKSLLGGPEAQARNGEILRLLLLSSHYRAPLNYADDQFDQAAAGLRRLYLALARAMETGDLPDPAEGPASAEFHARMSNDFNTPAAFAALHQLAHDIHRALDGNDPEQARHAAAELRALAGTCGLLYQAPEAFLQAEHREDTAEIEALIEARNQARTRKDWAEADALRKQLEALDIILEDRADGTVWQRR